MKIKPSYRFQQSRCIRLLAVALVFGCLLASSGHSNALMLGDIDGDAKITKNDLTLLINNFGKAATGATGDMDSNSKINVRDLSIFLTYYGGNLSATTPTTTPSSTALSITDPTSANPVNVSWMGLSQWAIPYKVKGTAAPNSTVTITAPCSVGTCTATATTTAAGTWDARMDIIMAASSPSVTITGDNYKR